MYIAHWVLVDEWVVFADQPEPVASGMVSVTCTDGMKLRFVRLEVYVLYEKKYPSSAVARLRRSDFIAAVYARPFVVSNFGTAIAASTPMITTTMSSSINVKPERLKWRIRNPGARGGTARM